MCMALPNLPNHMLHNKINGGGNWLTAEKVNRDYKWLAQIRVMIHWNVCLNECKSSQAQGWLATSFFSKSCGFSLTLTLSDQSV